MGNAGHFGHRRAVDGGGEDAAEKWRVTSGEWRMANKKAHVENSTWAFLIETDTIPKSV
jgi:hypothetical protein